ncbi:hypothetical protein CPB83DRAFT_901374 [Crepidotus variabilis]|uniref:Uncharacterized protein n=1 Tax=Crepidotus variabilis TaxID=179855 RepID=A0A9P6JX74_9AGAR|nr:hypothetical protein CPB83DRAFT_901374 [Crepidotus variabilis]
MYNLFLARRNTLALWGGIEAFFFGTAWYSYTRPLPVPALAAVRSNIRQRVPADNYRGIPSNAALSI